MSKILESESELKQLGICFQFCIGTWIETSLFQVSYDSNSLEPIDFSFGSKPLGIEIEGSRLPLESFIGMMGSCLEKIGYMCLKVL